MICFPVPLSKLPVGSSANKIAGCNAKARANDQARMKYEEFKKTRFAKTEASVFLYLQFLIMGAMFLFGGVILSVPFVLMFAINWKCVFLGVLLVPISFEVFHQARNGLKEVRQSL